MKLGAWLVMLTVMMFFLALVGIDVVGLSPILQDMGLTINITSDATSSSSVANFNVKTSPFWKFLFNTTTGVLIILAGTAVIVGMFARGYDTSLVLLPIIIFVGTLYISTFWSVIQYVQGFNLLWMSAVTVLIMGGLLVGFFWSLFDYFGAR